MFNSTNGMPFTMNVEPTGGNNDGFGNGGWGMWIWVILILAIFGWGNNGWNGNGSGAAENYVLASDFATLQRQIDTTSTNTNNLITNNADQIQRQITAIGNGVSSLGYDQLNQMNGLNTNIAASTYDIRNAIQNSDIANMQNTNAIGAQLTALGTQMASCCCESKTLAMQNAADLNYRLAEQSCQTRQAIADSTATIVANQDANTRSIIDFLTQDKLATLTAENAALKSAANNAAQTYEIISSLSPKTPIPSYIVQNPYCNCNYTCGC